MRDLQFIPCNLHPEVQAVEMGVNDRGVPVFLCRACDIAWASQDNSRLSQSTRPAPQGTHPALLHIGWGI